MSLQLPIPGRYGCCIISILAKSNRVISYCYRLLPLPKPLKIREGWGTVISCLKLTKGHTTIMCRSCIWSHTKRHVRHSFQK